MRVTLALRRHVTRHLLRLEVVFDGAGSGGGPAGRWVITQRPFLTATSILSSSRKIRFSSQPLDLTTNFPSLQVRGRGCVIGLEDDLRLAPFALLVPPRVLFARRPGLGTKPGRRRSSSVSLLLERRFK
jgi:hypothetical protein